MRWVFGAFDYASPGNLSIELEDNEDEGKSALGGYRESNSFIGCYSFCSILMLVIYFLVLFDKACKRDITQFTATPLLMNDQQLRSTLFYLNQNEKNYNSVLFAIGMLDPGIADFDILSNAYFDLIPYHLTR